VVIFCHNFCDLFHVIYFFIILLSLIYCIFCNTLKNNCPLSLAILFHPSPFTPKIHHILSSGGKALPMVFSRGGGAGDFPICTNLPFRIVPVIFHCFFTHSMYNCLVVTGQRQILKYNLSPNWGLIYMISPTVLLRLLWQFLRYIRGTWHSHQLEKS
jgi:hypothetical protein